MHEPLRLSNQLCFPLYALSKEITRLYTPLLQALDLTYPQYLVMMTLWEFGEQSVGEIGAKLFLDSGTLTPLLKRLQQKGIITRNRSTHDERSVQIALTDAGRALEGRALAIPSKISECLSLSAEEVAVLKQIMARLTENPKG